MATTSRCQDLRPSSRRSTSATLTFTRTERPYASPAGGSAWRSPRGLGRNALVVILILLGVLLSVPGVPGQGLLMVLIGLMLVDFPGRRRVEKALARRPGILATVNRLRARFGRPPLLPPSA